LFVFSSFISFIPLVSTTRTQTRQTEKNNDKGANGLEKNNRKKGLDRNTELH